MKIKTVAAGSLGESLGLKAGDRLLKINGRRVMDQLDYQFRIAEPDVLLELDLGGKIEVVAVDKEAGVDLGVELEDFRVRKCANDCVFCFVDQNPAGLRQSLYFRDGDYRLSFLYGHYITMTNMGQRELERIVKQRLSPLYVSIHATEVELRRRLFLYGKDDHLLDKLRFLIDHGIILHGQIVLCPTLNDGLHLGRTLDDLHPFSPGLRSVAIVPVGLTSHREGLVHIPPVTPDVARAMIEEYAGLDSRYRHADGGRFLLLSDEWYLLAGEEVPRAGFYQGLAMEENGVGQVRAFLDRFQRERSRFPRRVDPAMRITLTTGELAEPIFRHNVLPVLNAIDGLTVELQVLRNTLFGSSVTVAGLLSGRDFVEQLGGNPSADGLGSAVWTTHRILNNEGTLTLDDMTLEQISARLGTPLRVSHDSLLEIFGGDLNPGGPPGYA